MPQFFFHVRDGSSILTEEATWLPSVEAARVEAMQHAGRLLLDRGTHFRDGGEWRMEVKDERGLTLFLFVFKAVEAPTLRMENI